MRLQKLILTDIAYEEIIAADPELLKNKKKFDLETTEMFCRFDKAHFVADGTGLLLQEGGSVSFDTYLNSFSVGKWNKYTTVDTVSFSLTFSGKAKIRLFHSRLNHKGKSMSKELVHSIFTHKEMETATLSFGGMEKHGIYYATVEAIDGAVLLQEGGYHTRELQPMQDVKLAVNICTFKREAYVKRNMEILKRDILENPHSPAYGKIWVHISDNAGTLDGIVESDAHIAVDKNANLGGVGGFTRGLLEIKEVQDEKGLTHVLMMDDDATLNSASIELNYVFLTLLKPRYFRHTLGGKLLVLNVPYLQYEAGAQWNKGKIVALKNGLDIRKKAELLESEVEDEEIEYAGWWYCCIPLSEIDEQNLPLPLFIHRDDIEYGLRTGNSRFIFLNGVCIWHEAFAGKMPGALDYYDLRNEAIINAVQGLHYTKEDFKKAVFWWMMSNLVRYRYQYLAYNYKAAEDFCKGIDWLLATDGEALHKELLAMNYKAKKLEDFVGYKGLTEAELVHGEQGEYHLPYLRRLAQKLMLNGYFLPVKKNKVTVNDPYGSVYKLYRVGEYVVTDSSQNAYLFQKDNKEFLRGLLLMHRTMQLIDKKYDDAYRSYRERYRELTNSDFWKGYLGLEK